MVKKANEYEDIEKTTSTYDVEPYFELLDHYFERNSQMLVQHHINSFNQFIEEIIPSILTADENIISETITENKVIKYRLTFTDLGIKPPAFENDEGLMFPLDAIQRNLPYSSKYTATITQWRDIIDIPTGKIETIQIGDAEKDVPIAKIPIMIRSKYCNLVRSEPTKKHCRFDAGGYFIINGSEKVVLSIEAMIQRKPLVFAKKDQNSMIYYVQVHSRPVQQFVGNVQVFTIKMKKDGSIVLNIHHFKEISIFIMMRALGLETDEDIIDAILDSTKESAMKDLLMICINNQENKAMTREEAIEYMVNSLRSTKNFSDIDPEIKARQKRNYLMKILTQFTLPHISSGTDNPQTDMLYKAYYIGYMIHKLLKCTLNNVKETEENRGCDDRDSLINKRIETTGVLLGNLFHQFFKKMLNDCSKIFRNKKTDINKPPYIIPHIKQNIIEQGIRQALSTGTFGSQSRKGLSQMLNRLNHLHSLSYMRRIITPTVDASTNKMTSPRHLHNTHYGTMCPFETPEGPKTGLVKNLSLTASITINMNTQIPIVNEFLIDKITPLHLTDKKKLYKSVKVIMNGNWIGITEDVMKLHNDLREKRFNGEIEKTVSFYFDFTNCEYIIYTEGGRLYRPLLNVENNKLLFKPEMLKNINSWEEFVIKYPKVIEFLDKEEEQNMMLATFPVYVEHNHKIMKKKPIKSFEEIDRINRTNRYDDNIFMRISHCEIHPAMTLGVITSNIPFSDHNQGVRGVYQYNQARQSMGLYISDFRERTDISYILYHPQIPIVTSRASKYTGTHNFPSGENAIVAIASYSGFNQEDSLIMNLSSIQKGFMRAQAFKKYTDTIKKNPASSEMDIFKKPTKEEVDIFKDANYEKLTEEGFPKEETQISDGDVIIGMITPKPSVKEGEKPYKDNSTIYKSLIPGAIDKVITGINNDGYAIIKIRVRSERIPIIGDKFASRSGQKATIGYLEHRANMPFTEKGMIPDIIINPNCIPKRMTIGHILECLQAKVCVIKGMMGDATPFGGIDIEKINQDLIMSGYDEWGNETMYCGLTGVKMKTKIFIGPTYYLRLKQMVGDKAHSRARGAVQLLTRQPPLGRAHEGGLRCGEMERDAMCAHGISQFLKERLVDMSDITTAHICDICGLPAHLFPKKKYYICQTCKTTTKITKITVPFAFMLFLQELRSMNILGRIRTSKSITVQRQT